jgi:hypothetical protein
MQVHMTGKSVPSHQLFPNSGVLNRNANLPGWPEAEMPPVQSQEIADSTAGALEESAGHSDCSEANSESRRSGVPPNAQWANQQHRVFAYVLTSLSVINGKIIQTGCVPNFQGDCITLCTCMHRHRSWWGTWKGIWVAGFTGKSSDNCLFYLMQVGQEERSQCALWNSTHLPNRFAKSAVLDPFGDLYEPLQLATSDHYNPAYYRPPIHATSI